MKCLALLVLAAISWTSAAADKTTAEKAPLTADQRRLNIESFEHVWTTVRDKHWDPALGGLDWKAVHDELLPAVENATTMEQARAAMSEMLKRLKQTHFGILPADVYGEVKSGSGGGQDSDDTGEGSPGIDVRVIDGHALVTEVGPDSPAATAGIRPGWEILKVDGKDIPKSLKVIEQKTPASTLHNFLLMRSVEGRLSGDVGSSVNLELLDGHDKHVSRKLDRVKPRGAVAHLGNLPPLHFWVETRKLSGDIGYLKFNMFFEPDALMSAVTRIMKECTACRGFVIDLRGNPGGIGGLATGLAGWFMEKGGAQLGTMYLRTGQLHFAVFARPQAFRGPLAVLVDGCSASTSEIFAGGMKDLGRARIFGTRTAGAALPSTIERLPNGDGFQYAFANYISEGGKPLEGSGVTPDDEVRLTRRALLNGDDPVLDRAVAWIQTGSEQRGNQ